MTTIRTVSIVRAAAGTPDWAAPPHAPSAMLGPVKMMPDEETGSVSDWIDALKEGRPEAADAIWQRYYQRVVGVARRRLAGDSHQAVEDAEDVALSAIHGLCAGAAEGRFDRLGDRVDLWRLLVAITVKKTLSRRQRFARLKRGGPGYPGESANQGSENPNAAAADRLAAIPSPEPTPESSAIIQEQFQELLEALGDPTLREVALWRMDGLTNAEIAEKLGCVLRTVERKIEHIRLIWEEISDGCRRLNRPPSDSRLSPNALMRALAGAEVFFFFLILVSVEKARRKDSL